MPNYSGLWTRQAQLQAVTVPNWPGPPGAPTGVTAVGVDATSVSVSFTAPTNTGIPAGITGYRVTSSPGGITATGSASPITVTGLTTGQAYTFTVAAQNASGYGAESAASNSVTPANYIEDVFSTYLYTGNGSTQTITNSIDLSGKGGLVWIKRRSSAQNHQLFDTSRGVLNALQSNLTSAQSSIANSLTAFNSNGFTVGSSLSISSDTLASWTFREQPKFFDVVTFTSSASGNKTFSHNLGAVPGCVIIKNTQTADPWIVYHRSVGDNAYLQLNSTAAQDPLTGAFSATSTTFTISSSLMYNSQTYVAYLFAHDAGGFGNTGNDNVISCGSFTGSNVSNVTVSLGYEPQFILWKAATSADSWKIADNIRGMPIGSGLNSSTANLFPNLSIEEVVQIGVAPTATGFTWYANGAAAVSDTYIYIAIRRPMKTPTTGTSVFQVYAAADTTTQTVGFPTDMLFDAARAGNALNTVVMSRLQGAAVALNTSATTAENGSAGNIGTAFQSNTTFRPGIGFNWWCSFGRAPGFFDVVCYTGTGTLVTNTVTHNLTVAPELVIVKGRSTTGDWSVLPAVIGGTRLFLNLTDAATSASIENAFGNNVVYVAPTATNFTVTGTRNNTSGATYVTYLFASCAGVSKVGSYTGTGTTQQINCGFTGGARFVLIKRTDSTGDWYVWDSARGIVAGNDPYLLLNSTAAEVTNTDYVDTYAQGFEISSTAPAAINANGGTYLYLAIA